MNRVIEMMMMVISLLVFGGLVDCFTSDMTKIDLFVQMFEPPRCTIAYVMQVMSSRRRHFVKVGCTDESLDCRHCLSQPIE